MPPIVKKTPLNISSIQKLLVLTIFLMYGISSIGQKTDTIIHINGNILTGELKKMNYGVVTWKMDGMGTINLEEPKINSIISNKIFEIKMDDGQIYFASFGGSEDDRKVYLNLTDSDILVSIEDIVEVYPIKKNFWRRISGNVSLGVNYSKGSNVATMAFGGNFNYKKRNSNFSLSWDLNDTYQGDSLSASKSDVYLDWQRYIKNGWSANLAVGASQNLELGTKLRLSSNISGIKDITYNEWNRLYIGTGLNVSRETPFGDEEIKNDLTGIVQLKWKVYKLTQPKVWVDADLKYLPYFTDTGRNRILFNLNPQVSILSDNFKIGFNLYYNYDSKPRTEEASNDDYGLNLQFTYSLN